MNMLGAIPLGFVDLNGPVATTVWTLALALAMFVVSNLVLLGVMVLLPDDFFCQIRSSSVPVRRHWLVHLIVRVSKNVFGVLFLVLGGLLILPGVPGPGLVCILIGLAMVEFPGKRRLERKLLSYPNVLAAVNRLRARFGRAPLRIE